MTHLATPVIPKFRAHQPARPMLARDADAMYWMSRYVERAEHIARLLLTNSNLLMDVGELAPTLQQRQWQSVLTVSRLEAPPPTPGEGPTAAALSGPALGSRVAQHMVFDRENPNSLINCITRARE